MSLRSLQDRIAIWVGYNFPDQTPGQALHGMVEEFGEFLSSGTKDDRIDAIADFTIYAAGYCFANGLDLERGYITSTGSLSLHGIGGRTLHHGELVTEMAKVLGLLSHNHLKAEQKIRGQMAGLKKTAQEIIVGQSIHLVEHFHEQTAPGEDFFGSVFKVWNYVEQRDWKKYPQSGFPNELSGG